MNKFSFLVLVLFLSFSNLSFSQDKNVLGPNEFFTMHYYTFQGNGVQEKLDALELALSNIDMVSEAKVKFKTEKNMGQIVLVVKEKTISSEGDKSFSPTSIKQTIIKNGFSPMEYTVGKYDRK
jgi:hypothetical protein